MESDERILLRQASSEIKSLRKQNELMNARLTMFDDVMSALHGQPAHHHKQGGMQPDIVWEIEKHLEKQQ